MTRRRVLLEPAFVLHSYAYRESSLIVELLTAHHGRIALLARGARRARSALRGLLLAFYPLRLSWSGSGELRTLIGADWIGGQPALNGIAVMCGFYLNELLLRLLPREDPHEALFAAYAASLERLATEADPAAVLRAFEHRLLGELGYAPQLLQDASSGAPVDADARYAFDPERGPLAARSPAHGWTVQGSTLLDMARGDYGNAGTREEAKRLLRELLAQRLGGQELHTRAVLTELQNL